MNARVVLGGLVLGGSPRWHGAGLRVAGRGARELIAPGVTGLRQDAGRRDCVPCRAGWLSGGGKGCVRVREGGRVLQAAGTGRGCCACTRGAALFTAAAQWPAGFRAPAGRVLAVEVAVPGARSATAGR